MKKVLFTLSFLGAVAFANAQACGGTSSCTPASPTGTPGLTPVSSDLPCVQKGVAVNQIIKFENFTSFSGQNVNFLRIDSINNLPSGLCWKTNKANNQYSGGETGCIEVNGTSNAAVGQYKLRIHITANIGSGMGTNIVGDAETLTGATGGAPLRYYVRVINQGAGCPCVDTVNGASNFFVAYNGSEPICVNGINNIAQDINSMTVTPNPFSSITTVNFTSEKSANYTFKATNLVGAEVSVRTIEAKAGENSVSFEKGNLPSGVYFLSLSNEKGAITKKVIVE
ncbi:MAG: T9SS type A sorting domain-containing protein [Chitinophagales bacterium]